MKLQELQNLNGLTQAEVFPMYANLIVDNPCNSEVIRVNHLIISKWNNAVLILIKDKAWRIVNSVPKGQHLSKYI